MSQVEKFSQPDHSGNPRYFIEFLEMVDRMPGLPELHSRSFRQMRLPSGGSALDVGCGIGTAVGKMADLVGPEGESCGVDISEAMIAEAASRMHGRSNVEFAKGSACALPYADARFDAVRMERVLLYVQDREKAIAEMMRVTKPGGRVVVTDVDIDAIAITAKDRLLARRMTAVIADSFVHPASGRELPGLFRASGMEDITVEVMALNSPYEFSVLATQGTLRSAAEAGKVSMTEVDEWFRRLAEVQDAGAFMHLWFFVIVGGTVR